MRLFAALVLPAEVVAAVTAAVADARDVDPTLRWTSPAQWHLTVAFFGDVPAERLDDLQTRLSRAARRAPCLSLCLGGPGTFGSSRRSRVVWLGVQGDTDALRALAASCRAAGRRIKLTGDGVGASARFRPHVTLARLTPPGETSAVVAALARADRPCWRAETVTLVRSDLGAGPHGRAAHTALTTFALGSDSDAG